MNPSSPLVSPLPRDPLVSVSALRLFPIQAAGDILQARVPTYVRRLWIDVVPT